MQPACVHGAVQLLLDPPQNARTYAFIQALLDFVQRGVYAELALQGSRPDKVEAYISRLEKRPSAVYLAIGPSKSSIPVCTDKLYDIINLLSRVDNCPTTLFFCGKQGRQLAKAI